VGLKRHQAEQGERLRPEVRNALEAFRGLVAWQRQYARDDILVVRDNLLKVVERRRREEGG
jgi:hypothetical protein